MFDAYIALSDEVVIKVSSKHKKIINNLLHNELLGVFIPNLNILKKAKNYKYTLILCNARDARDVHVEGDTITVRDNFLNIGVSGYIIYFLYKIIDSSLTELGLLAFHSSAISSDKIGVLFVGPSGSGKSTVALGMAKKIKGISLVSNNRTIVHPSNNGCFIKYGSKEISLRNQSLKLLNLEDKAVSCLDEDSYYPTNYYTASDLEVEYDDKLPEIKYVIQVNISDGVREFIKLDHESAAFYLYDNSSKIALGDCILFNGQSVAPGFDSMKKAQNRLDLINKMLPQVTVYHLKGPLKFIEDKVMFLLKSR